MSRRAVSVPVVRLLLAVLLLGAVALAPTASRSQVPDTAAEATVVEDPYRTDDADTVVPYVETPRPVIDAMLAMAGVTEADTVYDLGSGDGRIPIMAAREYGARGVGIEIQAPLVDSARANARQAGVADRVTFRRQDLFDADISDATVVTLYLLPEINLKLRPKLFRELAPGTRVVSHGFDMGEWTPLSTKEVQGRRLYLWRIPEQAPDFVREQP
jgi:SAM-dependent methyltransferase